MFQALAAAMKINAKNMIEVHVGFVTISGNARNSAQITVIALSRLPRLAVGVSGSTCGSDSTGGCSTLTGPSPPHARRDPAGGPRARPRAPRSTRAAPRWVTTKRRPRR